MEQVFSYAVDGEDRLISVGPSWDCFAHDNGAENLDEKSILGQTIWLFLANPGVREIYQSIFRRVRQSQKHLEVSFRCDSPSLRRFMAISIQPGPNNGLLLTSRLLRAEPRTRMPFLDSEKPRTQDFLVICSWCKKVKDDPDWIEIEVAVENNSALQGEDFPQMTHGICQPCKAEALQGTH